MTPFYQLNTSFWKYWMACPIGYGFDGSRLAGDAGAAFSDQLTHSE
ncbi:hypothetical protein [Mycolicibacterium chubuense]|nr:hypothetical protein [Mycolicibacterium chubuense]